MNNIKNNISIGILWSKYYDALKKLDSALTKIETLEAQIKSLEEEKKKFKVHTTLKQDHWGKPKPSKKLIDDMTYEQRTESRYHRLVSEVKSGALDINLLSDQEQEIVRRLIKNE